MGLGRAVLSIRENYAQAMAVTAPLGSVVSTTTVAVAYAGGGVVFATIMAFIASAFWVYTLTLYSNRIASAGGYYTFVYAAYRSRFLAFSEALIELMSFIMLNVVNVLAVYLMIEAVSAFYGVKLPSWAALLVIVFSLAYPTLASTLLDVRRLLNSIVIVVATLEVVVLLALFTLSLTRGVRVDIVLPPSDASLAGLAIAFLLILVSFDGAGASTYLGEETRRPLDNVTKGMWLAFLIGGIAMIAGTYALVTLWPYSYADLAGSSQPLITITAGFGIAYAALVIGIAAKSLLISNIGTTLAAARILYNLSREGSAPEILSSVNSRGQPVIATALVGFLTTAITLTAITTLGVKTAFIEVGALTGIFWIAGRILDSLGAPLFLNRVGELGRGIQVIPRILLPILTFFMNFAGLTLSFLEITVTQISILALTVVTGFTWYMLLARFGAPGSLAVDNYNNVVRIEDLLEGRNGKIK
jgi:amino acid transporter